MDNMVQKVISTTISAVVGYMRFFYDDLYDTMTMIMSDYDAQPSFHVGERAIC